MDFELELVPVPASDVDRAKAFYTEKAGFNADHDHKVSDELRFVQLTPPGSALALAQPPRDVPESHADPLIPFRRAHNRRLHRHSSPPSLRVLALKGLPERRHTIPADDSSRRTNQPLGPRVRIWGHCRRAANSDLAGGRRCGLPPADAISALHWDRVDPFRDARTVSGWSYLCWACYAVAVAWPVLLVATTVGYRSARLRAERVTGAGPCSRSLPTMTDRRRRTVPECGSLSEQRGPRKEMGLQLNRSVCGRRIVDRSQPQHEPQFCPSSCGSGSTKQPDSLACYGDP